MQVCDLFQTRYRLFREVYRHRVVVSVDRMVGKLMRLLIPLFRLWMHLGIRPTDAALTALPLYLPVVSDDLIDPNTKDLALSIWKNIQTHKHDRIRTATNTNTIDTTMSTSMSTSSTSTTTTSGVNAHNTAVIDVRLGLSSMQEDPVEKVWFFDAGERFAKHLKIQDVTKLIGASPRVASETIRYQIHEI